MGAATADVVVIGAGVIGSSVAYALASSGRSVIVIERHGAPGQGSTSASSAIIRFNYSTFAGVATAWEAHYDWLNWADVLEAPDADRAAGVGRLASFVPTGSLCLDCPTHDPAKVLTLFDQIGVPYELWDAATIRARVPALDPARYYPPKPVASEEFWADADGELGGYYTPDAGFIDDPGLAAQNLAAAAQRRGAQFRFHTTVTAITTAAGRVNGVDVVTGGVSEHVSAPVVINVAGPASGRINALAGVGEDFAIGTRPMRAEVNTVPAPSGYNAPGEDGRPSNPGPLVADLDLGTYFRGTLAGELLVGGAEPACDPLHWLEDPEVYEPGPTAELYTAQLYRAARRMPDLTVPNRPVGIGAVYDVADDWIPIYDRTALPGFYVAIGTSGNQFKNAPLAGRYLVAIIEACEGGIDHDQHPVQFPLPHTGSSVDLSAFSRRRQVHAGSSFTVMG